MNLQDKLTSTIRAWFDGQGCASYAHHDNERTTTLDGQFDLGELAAHLLAEVPKANESVIGEACAVLCEETGAYRDEIEMAHECAEAIRRKFNPSQAPPASRPAA